MTKVSYTFLSSSVVERSAVNRLVAGSNPAWGVSQVLEEFRGFSNPLSPDGAVIQIAGAVNEHTAGTRPIFYRSATENQ